MKWYYEYLKLVRDGKPMSIEAKQALDRIPQYLNKFEYDDTYPKALISFIEGFIYLQKGDDEESHPMRLQVEQKFWLELFGFVDPNTHRQIINDIGLVIGAGSGKSTFMAALSLAVMMVGSYKGNDVIVLSNSIKQSHETFRTASEMAGDERSVLGDLKKHELLKPILGKIKYAPTNSQIEIRAMDNNTLDGTNVRLAIFDEFHSYHVNVIENVRKSSAPKRKNTGFTTVYISTNGQVRDSVFDDYYKRWEKILAGDIEDWSTFPMIYKMDDVEEVTNPDLYEKAMPFVRNISDPQIIKDMLAKTQGNPVAQAEILAKSFNIPQSSFNALFTTDELEATREIQDVEWGNEVTIGSDFSEVEDLTAISIMWRNENKLRTRNFAFLPENTFENKTSKAQRLMYVRLINEGSLILTKGSAIDQDEVYKWLDDYIQENRLMPIGFGGDAFFSKAYQRRVTQDYGEGMYTKIRQNVMSLSQPLKTVKARIAGGDFQSDDDLLLWALNNLRVKIDANNNIYPNKQKAVDKIDPVLATIQAYYVWELQDEDTGIAW